jgi:hypothetical protein
MKQHREKTTSYRNYRKDLKTGAFKSFLSYLLPVAAKETIGSLSTGLFAANIATNLAALAGAAIVGAAGVAVAGAITVSVVASVVGAIAITLGIVSLKKEYNRNKKNIEEIVGDNIQDGKVEKLKKSITLLTFDLGLVADGEKAEINATGKAALSDLLFSLQAIKGRNLREKLCDLYDVDQNLAEADPLNELFTKMSNKHPMLLAAQGRLTAGFNQLEVAYTTSLNSFTAAVTNIVNALENLEPQPGDRANLHHFIEKLNRLPGDNYYEKMACLYASEAGQALQEFLETEDNGLKNIDRLYHALQLEVETQYYELIKLTKEKTAGANAEDITAKISAFKKSLSLLEGIDNKAKLDKLFNNKVFERSLVKFEKQARAHAVTSNIPEAEMPNLTAAKQYIDKELFIDSFKTPLDYAKQYFTAFAGGMTSFGIVTGIAAIVGVSVATSGAGLGVLIGALVFAVVGFSLALWYSNFTKKRDLVLKKSLDTANDTIDTSCEHAERYLHEAANRPQNEDLLEFDVVADAPEPGRSIAPQIPNAHVDRLIEQNQFLERENIQLRQQLQSYPSLNYEGMESDDEPLLASSPQTPKDAPKKLQSKSDKHRFHRLPEQPNADNATKTATQLKSFDPQLSSSPDENAEADRSKLGMNKKSDH